MNQMSHPMPIPYPMPFDIGRDRDKGRDTENEPSYSYPANVSPLRGDQSKLAARIAANQIERLDELSLIGCPSLDPATRDVYEAALRLAARKVLED